MIKLIKQIIKEILNYIRKIYYTLKFFIFILLRTDCRNHLSSVKDANILYVLGNGPSLNEDIKSINYNNVVFCVVNRFYLSPYYKIVKPRYYVLADPVFFENEEEIEKIIDGVDWNMVLFVTYSGWKKLKFLQTLSNEKIKVVPYHAIPYNGFKSLQFFFYKRGLSMPKAQNVLVPSIFNGINLGYKIIYLYGADHSWTRTLGVNSQNQVCAVDTHFYDKGTVNFVPYNSLKMHELLKAFAQMFESYHQIRWYADKVGCRILNCTKDSFIDAFERA